MNFSVKPHSANSDSLAVNLNAVQCEREIIFLLTWLIVKLPSEIILFKVCFGGVV